MNTKHPVHVLLGAPYPRLTEAGRVGHGVPLLTAHDPATAKPVKPHLRLRCWSAGFPFSNPNACVWHVERVVPVLDQLRPWARPNVYPVSGIHFTSGDAIRAAGRNNLANPPPDKRRVMHQLRD